MFTHMILYCKSTVGVPSNNDYQWVVHLTFQISLLAAEMKHSGGRVGVCV